MAFRSACLAFRFPVRLAAPVAMLRAVACFRLTLGRPPFDFRTLGFRRPAMFQRPLGLILCTACARLPVDPRRVLPAARTDFRLCACVVLGCLIDLETVSRGTGRSQRVEIGSGGNGNDAPAHDAKRRQDRP